LGWPFVHFGTAEPSEDNEYFGTDQPGQTLLVILGGKWIGVSGI
jgi:hypothetical protein